MRQSRADGDHQISLGKGLAGGVGGETAGDADIKRVAVEQAPDRQRGGKIGAATGRQRLARRAGIRTFCATPGDQNDFPAFADQIRRPFQCGRIGKNRPGLRQAGSGGGVARQGNPALLQVKRHPEDHGLPMLARMQERPADQIQHPCRVMGGDIGGSGRQNKRCLIDVLVVPCRSQRAFPGKDHQRNPGAHRRWQGRHDLGQPRPAGDRGHADLAGRIGIAGRHRAGAMFVPGVVERDAKLAQTDGPMHVAIAQQGEQPGHALGMEGFGQTVVNPGCFRLSHVLHSLPADLRACRAVACPAPARGALPRQL